MSFVNRGAFLAAAAALGALGQNFQAGAQAIAALNSNVGPSPVDFAGRFRGHTQGSSRDTDWERHRNRLARKARRTERLHRHTSTGRRLLTRASA